MPLDTTPPSVSITGLRRRDGLQRVAFRVLVEAWTRCAGRQGPWRLHPRRQRDLGRGADDRFEGAAWTFDLNLTDGPHLVEAYVRDASGTGRRVGVARRGHHASGIEVIYPPLDMRREPHVVTLLARPTGRELTINGEGRGGRRLVLPHRLARGGPNRITLVASDAWTISGGSRRHHVDRRPPRRPGPRRGLTNASFVVISGAKERGATPT